MVGWHGWRGVWRGPNGNVVGEFRQHLGALSLSIRHTRVDNDRIDLWGRVRRVVKSGRNLFLELRAERLMPSPFFFEWLPAGEQLNRGSSELEHRDLTWTSQETATTATPTLS